MTRFGKYLVFATRSEAQAYCAREHAAGNTKAYVSTLNSHVMTGDPAPIVVNAKA